MYVIVGFHKILPEHVDEYIENVRRHAANSEREPGCPRYEVLQGRDDPTVMCLFEVFQDEEAFIAHRDSAHHDSWMELSRDWREVSPMHRYVMDFVTH